MKIKISAIEAMYNATKDPDSLSTLIDYAGSLLKFLGKIIS
jgi:hypothetical protein